MQSDEFETLLRRLDDDRERAGEKYEDIRRRLSRFFAWNDCFPEEDLVDMTFDRVASKPSTEHIQNIGAFIWGVAKNIRREFHRRKQPVSLEDLHVDRTPQTGDPEQIIVERMEEQRRQRCLQTCIQELSDFERELFLDYEYRAVRALKIQGLAERLNLTMGALRIKAHRIRRKVEVCALKCFNGLKDAG